MLWQAGLRVEKNAVVCIDRMVTTFMNKSIFVEFRKFRWSDYKQCEKLVERVWSFDKVFKVPELRKIASLGYTKGSLEDSNFAEVVEVDGKVVGFLFGKNDKELLFKKFIGFKLSMLWRLFWYPGQTQERDSLWAALKTHIKNRSVIVERGASEVLLFVVDPEYQGLWLGEKLWRSFRETCSNSGVDSIYVSTNTSGAIGFY